MTGRDTAAGLDTTAGIGLVVDLMAEVVGAGHVLTGERIHPDYCRDEALSVPAVTPGAVVRPADATQVAEILRIATAHAVPVTARGSGTGLSGAAVPQPGGLVLSMERMNNILEIDTDNHVAVVQPGVTLTQLDEAVAAHGLTYPVYPGELSGSLGGNVATNAGGMRAVRYGVTRSQVLGLEAVLATGEVIRTGGKLVKASTGYDLTQLIIGSEGTLAVVTEAVLRLYPPRSVPVDSAGPVPRCRRGGSLGTHGGRQRRRPADPRVHRCLHDGRDHPRPAARPRDPRRGS